MKTEKIKLIEDLEILLEDHQKYMDVLEIFCTTGGVDKELNIAYLQLVKKIQSSLESPLLTKYKISLYKPFQGDLYTAESEWDEVNRMLMNDGAFTYPLSWETLKPFLYQTQSEITKILHEINGDDVHIDVKKVIEERKTKSKILTEEIIVGPLSYKDGVLYFNGSIVENLTPQAVEIAKLFLSKPDEFITYQTIQDEVSKRTHLKKGNMQKLISDLRTELKKMTKNNLIKMVGNNGYIFEAKKLL